MYGSQSKATTISKVFYVSPMSLKEEYLCTCFLPFESKLLCLFGFTEDENANFLWTLCLKSLVILISSGIMPSKLGSSKTTQGSLSNQGKLGDKL